MSKPPTPNYDVFLSYSGADGPLAEVVKQSLRAGGLSVFSLSEAEPGADVFEAVREGIRDSLAFVALVTPGSLRSPSLAFEYGAAWVWSTPVYVLTSGVDPDELPAYYQRHTSVSLPGGLPRVVEAIKGQTQPLTGTEKAALADAYAAVGAPAEALIRDAASADRLAELFAEQTGRRVPSSRLLRELLRLRKTKKLPRVSRPAAG